MNQTNVRQATVLVADNEPFIRALLERFLRQNGFAVLSAAHGQEAVDIYRQHQEAISSILLDVQMPVLDGPQSFLALRQISPDVPCCFMTGGMGGYSELELLDLGAACVFHKPFRNMAEVALVLGHLAEAFALPEPGASGPPISLPPAAAGERRRAPRHESSPVEILVAPPEATAKPAEGKALNRSLGGLCLLTDKREEGGAVLNVRPAILADFVSWLKVEVKHCRPQNHHWALGCQVVGRTSRVENAPA